MSKFDSIFTRFQRQPNGWWHAIDNLPNRFSRFGRGPLLAVTPDNRIKAFGSDLDDMIQPINGNDIQFERRSDSVFQVYVTPTIADSIKNYTNPALTSAEQERQAKRDAELREHRRQQAIVLEEQRQKRVAAKQETYNMIWTGLGESPVENARDHCYFLLDRDGERTKEFWFMRSAINTPDLWRSGRKEKLEVQVLNEIQAAKEWIIKWNSFIKWWKTIPKTGQYNDIYLKLLLDKFESDMRYMKEQLAITEEHGWRGEIILAAGEQGLIPWEESEDWDDGFIWFKHSETGVIFPFNCFWLHYPEQRSPWKINNYWSYNTWYIGVHPLEDLQQDRAWQYLTFALQKSTTLVGPNFDMARGRLCPYLGERVNKPNHLYRPICAHVKEYANTNSPPVNIPLF